MVNVQSRYIEWKHVSTKETSDYISYEFEATIPDSERKGHLSVVTTPDGEYRSYSII